jgi:hypothetical protein
MNWRKADVARPAQEAQLWDSTATQSSRTCPSNNIKGDVSSAEAKLEGRPRSRRPEVGVATNEDGSRDVDQREGKVGWSKCLVSLAMCIGESSVLTLRNPAEQHPRSRQQLSVQFD